LQKPPSYNAHNMMQIDARTTFTNCHCPSSKRLFSANPPFSRHFGKNLRPPPPASSPQPSFQLPSLAAHSSILAPPPRCIPSAQQR
jgi:hypothetical protein